MSQDDPGSAQADAIYCRTFRIWLEHLDLGEYVEAFAANKIDTGVLTHLTIDDLKDAVGDDPLDDPTSWERWD